MESFRCVLPCPALSCHVNVLSCAAVCSVAVLYCTVLYCTGGIIFSNTAGLTTADLDTFEYTRRVHLYPFETDLVYAVEEEAEAIAAEAARL